MPALTCYRIRAVIDGTPVASFDEVLAEDVKSRVVRSSTFRRPGLTAVVYSVPSQPHTPSWATFLQQGFTTLALGRSGSPSALMIVRIRDPRYRRRSALFAFTFGPMGRHLLNADAYERGFGLRASLNLIYPRGANDSARLRTVDSKRRGPTVLRSRDQSSDLADFEVFDVNRLRDVISKAHGLPADTATWGRRIGGGDSLTLNCDISIGEIGRLCRDIEVASRRADYTDRFSWIDDLQPVNDPTTKNALEYSIVEDLRQMNDSRISLAPPEILDWDRVAGFRFHFDRTQGPARSAVARPDLRLIDYLTGVFRNLEPDRLNAEWLRPKKIYAVDENGETSYQWNAWRCLIAEIQHEGDTYILDEGEFYKVSADYIDELNAAIANIKPSARKLPSTKRTTKEADYNVAVAADPTLLLLDQKTVRIPTRTTAIEICDLLSTDQELIHVKRHLGSADLSHLFAQGLVSAQLLLSSVEFRRAAEARIAEVCGTRVGFSFISNQPIKASDFEVFYAIAEDWKGRSVVEALPFFSKVNLREVATRLREMGFRLTLNKIDAQ